MCTVSGALLAEDSNSRQTRQRAQSQIVLLHFGELQRHNYLCRITVLCAVSHLTQELLKINLLSEPLIVNFFISLIPDYCCARNGGGVIIPDNKRIPESRVQLCTPAWKKILKVCVCHLGNSCGGRRWCNDKNGLNLHLQYIYKCVCFCPTCFRVTLNIQ